MPGPVSDSYDCEWGTSANRTDIEDALGDVYARVSNVLSGSTPMYILYLVNADLPRPITGCLTEQEWRLIRFAIERAKESL